MSVYVGNLSYEVTEDNLNSVFAEYGSVKRIQLPIDRETGRLRGFGFVEMSSEDEETVAIEALDSVPGVVRTLKDDNAGALGSAVGTEMNIGTDNTASTSCPWLAQCSR